jgi:hypothetical protein
MDDKEKWELTRQGSDNAKDIVAINEKLSGVINRQEKHEVRFEQTFEKLSDSLAGINTKLEVVIAQSTTKESTFKNITPYVVAFMMMSCTALVTYLATSAKHIEKTEQVR